MEKIKFINPTQELIFSEFADNTSLTKQFYFTGGTALSAFYLNHRESEDLDYFTENNFNNSLILPFMDKVSQKLGLPVRFTQRDNGRFFEYVKNDKLIIKVDFVYHPYKRIEKGKTINNVIIDSLRDIATNKLLTINQRTDIKDFVDLYFLLKEFTLWDLIYGVEAKFRTKLDLILIASDFLKVKEFDVLPRMLVPLRLEDLQEFFVKESETLAKQFTK